MLGGQGRGSRDPAAFSPHSSHRNTKLKSFDAGWSKRIQRIVLMSKNERQQKSYPARHVLSLTRKPRTGHSHLHRRTCDIDLDLQVPFGGHRKGRPLGKYSTLHSFGNHGRFAAGVTVARSNAGLFLTVARSMEKIMDQQQPVKYEKHTEIIENHCKTGGILRRSTRKKIKWKGET